MYQQQYYQAYVSLKDPPSEKESIKIFLSKISSQLMDMVMEQQDADYLDFEA